MSHMESNLVTQDARDESARRMVDGAPGEERPYADTLGAAVARASRELAAAGVPDARLDAEILLAYVLAWEESLDDIGCRIRLRDERLDVVREKRVHILAHPEEPLSPWAQRYAMFVRERGAGRPVAYWLEAAEFMGLQFYVNRYVLIPRPETETLVEQALTRLKPIAAPVVLDIGTGSGNIALSFAVFRQDAHVWAIDVSPQALRVARKNARWLKVRERFHWSHTDFLTLDPAVAPPFTDAAGNPAPSFDAVLSNPPYVAEEEAGTLSKEVLREPREALFAGNGGFAFIDAILAKAAALLKPGGLLLVEVGHTQGSEARRRAIAAGWQEVDVLPDLAGVPRVLAARRP
jgi:release factor glutamine methyltransferase